jgi:hypothetical protein
MENVRTTSVVSGPLPQSLPFDIEESLAQAAEPNLALSFRGLILFPLTWVGGLWRSIRAS